jgi:hypothetical protein
MGGDIVSGDKLAGDKVMGDKRTINTQGGDYAEGNIDKRQGVFISGGTVYGPIIGQRDQQPPQHSTDAGSTHHQSPRIRLKPQLQPLVFPGNDRWASIEVINEEVSDLTVCRGTLTQIVRISDDATTAAVVAEIPQPLAWSARNPQPRDGLATIYRGDSLLLDIARTDQGRNVLLFTTTQDDWNPQPPGRYRVRVRVGGKLDGISFQPLIIKCVLIYGGGTDLAILPTP